MTNVKRIFSMLLALVMVFGSMSVLGTVANATPAGYEHFDDDLWETAQFETAPYTIKSYADLVTEYGSDWSDNQDQNPWLYMGAKFYEFAFYSHYNADYTNVDPNGDPFGGITVKYSKLFFDDLGDLVEPGSDEPVYLNFVETDHHVEPGQLLYVQYHMMGNIAINIPLWYQFYSLDFFDLEPQLQAIDYDTYWDCKEGYSSWADVEPDFRGYVNQTFTYDAAKDLANDGWMNSSTKYGMDENFGTRMVGHRARENPDFAKHIWYHHQDTLLGSTNDYRLKGWLWLTTYHGVEAPNCKFQTNHGSHYEGSELWGGMAFERYSKFT